MLEPSVGVLLRLSFACSLGVPLSCVTITSVNTTIVSRSGGAANVSAAYSPVPSGAPVNAATGNCSAVNAAAGRRSLADAGSPSAQPSVAVTLSVGVPSSRAGALAALVTTTGDASGVAGSPGSPFAAFAQGGAAAAGVSPAAVALSGSCRGCVTSRDSSSVPGGSAGIAPAVVIFCASVGGALLVLAVLLLAVVIRRRKQGRKAVAVPAAEPPTSVGDVVAMDNPMGDPRARAVAQATVLAPSSARVDSDLAAMQDFKRRRNASARVPASAAAVPVRVGLDGSIEPVENPLARRSTY